MAENITIGGQRMNRPFDRELDFFKILIQNFQVPCRIFDPDALPSEPRLDLGLRSLLRPDYTIADEENSLKAFLTNLREHVIYRVYDSYFCNYLILVLPSPEKEYLCIGPYLLENVTQNRLLEIAEVFNLPAEKMRELEKFYRILRTFPDDSYILTMLNTFCSVIWDGIDNFTLEDCRNFISFYAEPLAERPDYKESEDASVIMKTMEKRYQFESELMQAVRLGQLHKAEMLISRQPVGIFMERRVSNPVRNRKNYLIILNTILRKAAEYGNVHPLHIDSISSRFALRIEQIISEKEADALPHEMVRKYCLLVKNHSLQGYSSIVKEVLTRIDSDLTADLGLKTQAELLNVNPNYLSTLFKKETGSTLTEYVNRKRIEKALFLLNSTDLQISSVAQFCGIPDANYFTKLFKKQIGITPKEYRDLIV